VLASAKLMTRGGEWQKMEKLCNEEEDFEKGSCQGTGGSHQPFTYKWKERVEHTLSRV